MRQNWITRTIKGTKVKALFVNTVDQTTAVKEVTIPRTYDTPAAVLKIVQKSFDTETEKAVSIVETAVTKGRYGMLESDFVKRAILLSGDGEENADTTEESADTTDESAE